MKKRMLCILLLLSSVSLFAQPKPALVTEDLTVTRIEKKMWVIETDDKVSMYLIEGKQEALLFDTGTHPKDLYTVVRTFTDKPLKVVLSHNHPDHTGGISFFDQVWMHPADTVVAPFTGYKGKVNYVKQGDRFDLGGIVLEVEELPGHTPGSIALVEWNKGICFSGDAIGSGQVYLHIRPTAQLTTYAKTLLKVRGMLNRGITKIYCGHYPAQKKALGRSYVAAMEDLVRSILWKEAYSESASIVFPGCCDTPMMASANGVAIFYDPQKTLVPQLIVRGDDIGSAHAANLGVIKTYTEGICRTTEIMVVAPWFPEAVKMLRENPGLDIGLHLVLTSEWENMKWRPLTRAASITDELGYFFPNIFPNEAYPGLSLTARVKEIRWKEVENELRAQIKTALEALPQISHLSGHMGWSMLAPEAAYIADKLSKEFNLPYIDAAGYPGVEYLRVGMNLPLAERNIKLFEAIDLMEEGHTYLLLDHPALDGDEMRAIWHTGYENVAEDRQGVVNTWTDQAVKNYLYDKYVRIISYGTFLEEAME